jgi:hypothetical protein
VTTNYVSNITIFANKIFFWTLAKKAPANDVAHALDVLEYSLTPHVGFIQRQAKR